MEDEILTHPERKLLPEEDEISNPSVIMDANDDSAMAVAGEIIRNGGLVSFPTETVYGLGANALDAEAWKKIFETKERPMTDPLIVHICQKEDAYELIDEDEDIVEVFSILADRFWPGPFTCVMNANSDKISPVITADTGYVGVRCPNHDVAIKLIKEAKRPIAAPSANKFGHVSPTKAEHVFYDFKGDGVYILDGGQCNFGIESTVVKIYKEATTDDNEIHIKLLILRRGGVSESAFKKVVSEISHSKQNIKLFVESIQKKHFTEESHKMEAPGQFLRHYAPNLPSYMLVSGQWDEVSARDISISNCVLIDFNSENINLKEKVSLYLDLSVKGDFVEAIGNVYDYLRISETQEQGEMVLIANLFDTKLVDQVDSSHSEHQSALFDRLFRAVTGQGIKFSETFTKYSLTKL